MDNPMRAGPSALRTSIRLSLQYSFLYSVLSAFVFALAYWFTQYEVQDWVFDQMRSDAATLAGIFELSGNEALLERVDALAEVSFENARVYQLLNANGVIVSGNLASTLEIPLPDFVPAQELPLAGDVHNEVSGYWLRVDEIGPYRLIQGTGDHLVLEILEALGIALVVGYLAVVAIGLIAGIRIGRITERRIAAISDILAEVSSGNLASRIPTSSNPRDDLSRLSAEINSMLGQITRLLESQEQISNDIAHDMRTPLQHLRQRLERLRDSPTINPGDISASLNQTEEIIATFNALLRIAQIEGSDRRERFERNDLCEIIATVAEVFEPTAEDAGIELTDKFPRAQLEVLGDRNLLMQLLSNLVENAIKHCPSGSKVLVRAESTPDGPTLRVTDNGPGIKCEDRERIFRRFFRGEKSRNSPGNGLGLALAKAICDLHGADITVSDNEPGANFEIVFRGKSDPEPSRV